MADLSPDTRSLVDEVVRLRRDFHEHPELGFQEHRSAARIASYLRDLDLDVREGVAETGVTALLRGSTPGKTLLLRADMDALPLEEQTGLPFASSATGVMHACGHDAHMASMLVAAKILSGMQNRLSGNVRFVFQPNEEVAGARRMIDEGKLTAAPKVDGALGIHVWSSLPLGTIGIMPGPVMAAMDEFRIVIRGKGGHTGAPQYAIDPVLAAASLIVSVQMIQTREVDVLTPTLVMFGNIHAGGDASNIVPEEAVLAGTVRYLYEGDANSAEQPRQRFARIVEGICTAHGTEFSLKWIPSNPCLVNDPEMSALVREIAAHIIGDENIVPFKCMAGEDFAEFAREVPSAFVFVGAGNRRNARYPHHHPKFDIDEAALPIAVDLLVRSTQAFLSENRRTEVRGNAAPMAFNTYAGPTEKRS